MKLNEQALRVLFAFHRFCKPQNSCVLPAPLEGIILKTVKEKRRNNPIQAVLVLPGLLKRRRIFEIVRCSFGKGNIVPQPGQDVMNEITAWFTILHLFRRIMFLILFSIKD